MALKSQMRERKKEGELIIITWELRGVRKVKPILFNLKPREKKHYPLLEELLCLPGIAVYKIVTRKSPEEILKEFEEFAEKIQNSQELLLLKMLKEGVLDFVPPRIPLQPSYVLAQFRVEDRASWLHQENIRKRQESLSLILTETAKRQELLLDEMSEILQSLNEQAKQQTDLTNVIKRLTVVLVFLTVLLAIDPLIKLVKYVLTLLSQSP